MNNENRCRFWCEAFGPNNMPLKERFPELFEVCRDQECTIREALDKNLVLSFRRNISGNLLRQWLEIVEYVNVIPFSEGDDTVVWSLSKNGVFSTKSM